MDKRFFPAVFEKQEGGFAVSFPDLPGCITCGNTIEESLKHAQEALALYLDGLNDVPSATEIKRIITELNNDSIVLLVEEGRSDDIVYFKKSDIPQYFDNALQKKGYTKYQVAKILGVDNSYIGRIAKGDRLPSVDMAKRIATLLEIDWRLFYSTN